MPDGTKPADPAGVVPSASFVLHGISAAPGIAIARAQRISHAVLEVAHYEIPAEGVLAEHARFKQALAAVRAELEKLQAQIMTERTPAELGAFLDVHWMLLHDPAVSQVPLELMTAQRCNAEWALTQQMNTLVEQFEQFEDAYLRERKADVVHVVERVLKALMGKQGIAPLPRDQHTVLVAHDLSPADVIQYKSQQFASFITDLGGVTSHTAIVARSLAIPSVVALHNARTIIRENELLIVDGDAGLVIVNPDEAVLAEYRVKQNALTVNRERLKLLVHKRTESLDGTRIALNANIELPDDLKDVIETGADGIGLFRSEFLFLNRNDLPNEEEQVQAYRTVAEGMTGKAVTIRTFDLGADKRMPGVGDRVTTNPALGLRAIRLCLAEPKLFLTQLRAILRASHYGKVRILIPMLASAQELTQTLALIQRAKDELRAAGQPFDDAIPIGGMVEVPAAVIALEYFTRKLDFFSIGTNDLIQYTLAIDRADDAVAHLYDPLHPAILRLVAMAIRTANKAGKPIAVCGEMAGEVRLARVLLGMGLREYSMDPTNILPVKQRLLTSDVATCEALVQRILKTDEPARIAALVEKLNA
jgi:phosphoenolpyruvate-protein phosphotransferase (PTS system enzyme I)